MMICLDPYSILEEERDRLRAELAQAREEIAKLRETRAPTTPTVEMVRLRQSNQNLMMLYANAIGECRKINKAIHRVLRGRNNAVKQLAAEKARADRAEQRVRELEEKIVRYVMAEETLDHYCNGPDDGRDEEPGVEADLVDEVDVAKSDLDSEARAILAACARKEGGGRG